MISKIDRKLLEIVKTSSLNDDIDCLVYAQNYQHTRHYLTNVLGCKVVEYPFIRAFSVKTNLSIIKKIAYKSHVRYVSSISKVFAQMDKSRNIMNIDNVQKIYTGSGVNVAIIDTGISPNLDFCSFKNRILTFVDFVNEKTEPYDDNGHGTFVAGTLAGNGFLSGKKYCGVAPNSNLVICKTLDANGECNSLKILEAMQWVYNNRKKYNIKVVCMSFGSSPLESGDPLMMGAESLWNEGIVVVAAAGNSGPNSMTIKSPGISGKIITVGALDDGRQIGKIDPQKFCVANFSSRGPAMPFYKPDCIACGVDVTSVSFDNKKMYTQMSGTSVATPIVAGSCALLLQKFPNLTPFEVKSKLLSSCIRIYGDRNSQGVGYLDVSKFVY